MKPPLPFDFIISKETNTINVTREFAANLDLVWDTWTKAEILDQWWAPKPWISKTKFMDFKVGGRRFYAMISPQGEEHWSIQKFSSISPKTNIKTINTFADQHETINAELPESAWDLNFSEQNETTTVRITITHKTFADIEQHIQMGFKEGLTMSLENLDQYIEAKFKLRKQNKPSNKARVSSYLNFDGKTEEAFIFYKKVFKTEFIGKGIQRFGEIPAEPNHPPVAEAIKKMVLHVELPITGNHILMGTDAPKEMGFTLTKGNNMHLCLEPETREEADRLFNELSAGGNITMPMADMFFGAYFGEFSDQYGINWMINFQK